MSHWSYCRKIPLNGKEGYYRSISAPNFISGPILVTHTINDLAVGKVYPLAAKAAGLFTGAIDFGTAPSYPKYGAVGAHGARGDGINIHNMAMLPESGKYSYISNHFYNIDSSQYMKKMDGLSGAHSDISHPEVAHAFFSAIK